MCRVVPCVSCRVVSCAHRKTSPKQPPPTFSKHFISWGWTSGGPEWRPAPAAPPPAAEADVDADAVAPAAAAPRAELGAGAGSTLGLDGVVVVRVGVPRPDVDEEGAGLVGADVGVVVEGAGADDESWSDPRSSGARRKSSLCSVLRASIPFCKNPKNNNELPRSIPMRMIEMRGATTSEKGRLSMMHSRHIFDFLFSFGKGK